MKPVIALRPLLHKKQNHISIGFKYNDTIKTYIKAFEGVKWSTTHKTFYVPYSKEQLHKLFTYLQTGGYYVDYSGMTFTEKPLNSSKQKVNPLSKADLYKALSKEQQLCLTNYVKHLRGLRLSESTVSTYGYFILRFLYYTKHIEIANLKTHDITLFMEDVIAKEHYSISSHRQCVSAFKHLTLQINLVGFDASTFERPKKSQYLPTVLSKEAIIRLLQVTKNLKHRAILGLLYSGGLRIGELLNMTLKDLDFERSQIHIRQSKGRKDRFVMMSEVLKPLLYNYISTYAPKHYVIEGRDDKPYRPESIRAFLKRSCKLAGIKKTVTPHTLRHSYATHMLENGVDLRYIQALLGHAKPETTMIYTHVAKKDIMQIRNPLDVTVASISESVKSDKKVIISRK